MKQTSPRIGLFWFISEQSGDRPSQSRMVARFDVVKPKAPVETFDQNGAGRRYKSAAIFADEEWYLIKDAFPFIGWRDHTYYPSGRVSWRDEDNSALFLIDPALNAPAFLEVIAAQSGMRLDRVVVMEKSDVHAVGKIGLPCEGTYDAQVPIHQCEDRSDPFESVSSFDLDRAHGAFLGLAVGDALGASLEFSERDTLPLVTEMIGGGPFELKPGQWTDDTSMALCLADSIIAKRRFDERDLLERFVKWWEHGENSVTGYCFDIGNATRQALERFKQYRSGAGSGPREKYHAGNGSLMRLAPVAIFAAPDKQEAVQLAEEQSEATHANNLARDSCRLFATMLVEAMSGLSKKDVLRSRYWFAHPEIIHIASGHWTGKTREEISSSGYVVSTLEAAIWCVDRTSTFEEALILAVNLGGDSDTIGAVTGQLAGAIYGRSGIPEKWLSKLAWRAHIEERTEALRRARSESISEEARK